MFCINRTDWRGYILMSVENTPSDMNTNLRLQQLQLLLQWRNLTPMQQREWTVRFNENMFCINRTDWRGFVLMSVENTPSDINSNLRLHQLQLLLQWRNLTPMQQREWTVRFNEGPYNLIVYNTSNCVTEQPWFHTNTTVFSSKGRSLLRGTLQIQRELKHLKFRIAVHYMDEGRIKVFEIKNQNCQNTVIRLVLHTLGIRYNQQRCTIKPMTTEFDSLNLDSVFHTVVQKLWYGSVEVRWEIAVPTALIMCLDIHIQIVKAINGDNKAKS